MVAACALALSPSSQSLSTMSSRTQRVLAPVPQAHHATSVSEALSRLGMTREQFAAKQAELSSGLLCIQPFVPKPSNPTQPPSNERALLANFAEGRSRSNSVSSSSSRNASPAPPRTPARHDRLEGGHSRPRDQMEMILEEQNRRKASHRRGSLVVTCSLREPRPEAHSLH